MKRCITNIITEKYKNTFDENLVEPLSNKQFLFFLFFFNILLFFCYNSSVNFPFTFSYRINHHLMTRYIKRGLPRHHIQPAISSYIYTYAALKFNSDLDRDFWANFGEAADRNWFGMLRCTSHPISETFVQQLLTIKFRLQWNRHNPPYDDDDNQDDYQLSDVLQMMSRVNTNDEDKPIL